MSDSQDQPVSGPKRQRSPAYPLFDLEAAVGKARMLYTAQGKHDGHLHTVMRSIGYDRPTGLAQRAVAALDQFGLVEQTGEKDTRRVKLTELARDVLELPASDPRHPAALKTAALSPKIYAHLWERYGPGALPSDDVMRSHLLRDKEFNGDAADSVLETFRATVLFAKLDKLDGVQDGTTLKQDPAVKQEFVLNPGPEKKTDPPAANPQTIPLMVPTLPSQELPVLIGPGMIARIPFPMNEDDFDLLIGTLNLWKKRLVKAADSVRAAIWRNNDFDKPVVIVGELGEKDGEKYYQTSEGTVIPGSQLTFE